MAVDATAVLDGHGITAAHVVGASLGGAIGQWLAVHRPERVLTLAAIMTGPMGHDAGPAWARALGGQAPDPGDLPPPSLRPLLPHGAALTAEIPGARLRRVDGMGHGFFSPGLPRRVAGLVLEHTG
jgi:hypothetical protein